MYGVKEEMEAIWFGVLAAQRVGRIANWVPNGGEPAVREKLPWNASVKAQIQAG